MYHDPDFTLAHPCRPLRDFSPRIQGMFGYAAPKRASVTKDGRLTFSCGNTSSCTCKPTMDATQAPGR
jgi:hypothetical protein